MSDDEENFRNENNVIEIGSEIRNGKDKCNKLYPDLEEIDMIINKIGNYKIEKTEILGTDRLDKNIDTTAEYKNKLDKMNIMLFKKDLDFIITQLVHYQKLGRRWKKVQMYLKNSAIGIGIICSIGTVVVTGISTLGSATFIVIPLTVTLGSLGLGTGLIESIIGTIFKKKNRKYKKDN